MNQPLPKPVHNKRKRLRQKAREKIIKLLEKQQHKCHWCKCLIYASTELKNIIKLSNCHIWCQENDEVKMYFHATIDHLVKIADGGGNENNNIVASCYNCNKDRTKTCSQPHPCPGCGKIIQPKERKCIHCKLLKADKWLESCGWVKQDDIWIDPITFAKLDFKYACAIQGERNKNGYYAG